MWNGRDRSLLGRCPLCTWWLYYNNMTIMMLFSTVMNLFLVGCRLCRAVFTGNRSFVFAAKSVRGNLFIGIRSRDFDWWTILMPQPIIFGVAPRFLSPVKKMLRVFAMLYDFLLVIRFFFKRLQKVVPSLIASA